MTISTPISGVRSVQHELKNVKEALFRAENATDVAQLSDALISVEFFYGIVKEFHISMLEELAKNDSDVIIPEHFKREAATVAADLTTAAADLTSAAADLTAAADHVPTTNQQNNKEQNV